MKVTAIMATCGRHLCSERSLSLFLRQTYQNKHLLIYQNSEVYQQLDKAVPPDLVTLVNNHLDLSTGISYTNLGAIYNDALRWVPSDTEVIIFWDDDDLFLETHIECGMKGLLYSGRTAYKPSQSYYRTDTKTIVKVDNTLEPSIFVKAVHLYKYGFSRTTSDQHLQWIDPLVQAGDILADEEGEPTLIYNWGDPSPMYKTSGDFNNPENFNNYRRMSKQHGDRVISPTDIDKFYADLTTSIRNNNAITL